MSNNSVFILQAEYTPFSLPKVDCLNQMNENSPETSTESTGEVNTLDVKEDGTNSANTSSSELTYNDKDIPSADESSSRRNNDLENAGFTQEEFASLLGKYDYNFKPGDLVKGTVFALEPKGAMIDIGAKTAAFMPMQEVSINRVEGLSDVLQPSETREFLSLIHI